MDSTKPQGVPFPLVIDRRENGVPAGERLLESAGDLARMFLACRHEDPLTMRGRYDPAWKTESHELGGEPIGKFEVMGCGQCYTWVIAAGPAYTGPARLVPKVEGG